MSGVFKKTTKKFWLSGIWVGKRSIIMFLGIMLLVSAFVVLIPEHTSTSSQRIVEVIIIRDNVIVSGPSVVTALQGDAITLRITANQPNELHLHGYDNKVKLEANKEAVISFKASQTGKFDYELEQSGVALGQLQIYPR